MTNRLIWKQSRSILIVTECYNSINMSSNFQLCQAAKIISNNGIISYPTDSVYGLGCDPLSEIAVNRILKLKNRPVEKGLIIIAGNINQLLPFIDISKSEAEKIITTNEAISWLVKKSEITPHWISGKHSKVAIRICKHPLVINLCKLLNQPIVSTSANPAGAKPATSNPQSRRYFLNQVDYYLTGPLGPLKKPTSIINIETGLVIR